VHFTMSQCALQSVEDFFGLHIVIGPLQDSFTCDKKNSSYGRMIGIIRKNTLKLIILPSLSFA
jgi:hypothetical protein